MGRKHRIRREIFLIIIKQHTNNILILNSVHNPGCQSIAQNTPKHGHSNSGKIVENRH